MTIIYAKRQTAFDRGEDQWRAEDEALIWVRPGGESVTIPWRDVATVRAAFAPTNLKRWRHVLEIVTRQRLRLVIDNAHFRGIGDFEDRSEAFARFALACIERVAAASPGARGWLGSSWPSYLIQMGFGGGMLLLLCWLLFSLPDAIGGIVVVKLLLLLVMLPTAAVWAIRSRPRKAALTPDAFRPGLPPVDA